MTILYHGPGSHERANAEARKWGRILVTPEKIDKDGAREVVGIMSHRPMGNCSMVLGPFDEIRSEVSDVLLKTLEENTDDVRVFLWAWDIGGVSKTIVGRCLTEYAGGVDERVEFYMDKAKLTLKSYTDRDWTTLVDIVKEAGDYQLYLRSMVSIMSADTDRWFVLWGRLRLILDTANLTPARILDALLSAAAAEVSS